MEQAAGEREGEQEVPGQGSQIEPRCSKALKGLGTKSESSSQIKACQDCSWHVGEQHLLFT